MVQCKITTHPLTKRAWFFLLLSTLVFCREDLCLDTNVVNEHAASVFGPEDSMFLKGDGIYL